MNVQDDRLARIHLSAALEPGEPHVLEAVRLVGAAEVVDRLRAGDSRLDPDGRCGRRLAAVDPRAVAERATACGIDFVVPADPAWPTGLDDLASVVRDRRGCVPAGLWARGFGDVASLSRSVAVVGSRAASVYGTSVAGEWAAALAQGGVAVVSGAAYGIDAAAHRGALAVDGMTVAVLACGLDQAYPRGNAALIERISEHGLLLSEAAPGSVVNRGRFLSRNRLIAAIAGGTLVVEAGARSGALSTARWAEQLMRPLAAVPGPVTSAMSVGPHSLVREVRAVLASRPDDVIELVGDMGTDAVLPLVKASVPTDGLSPSAALVHDSLPTRGPVTVAELMVATGLGVSSVVRACAELAERGLLAGEGDVWTRRVSRPVGSR
ncbi:MAG: DNA-processing protein DprA [Jiangellales bacterium]